MKQPVPFFYSDDLLAYDMGPQHPMRPERLRMTRDLIASYGMFDAALDEIAPPLADTDVVGQTHSIDYLEVLSSIQRGDVPRSAGRFGLGTGDNPIFRDIYEASLRYTGASLAAAERVASGDSVAINISGGLHHAHYARAAGFCVLNDCAVAATRLRETFARVAYVDIDVHHGDGVQELFYSDPAVLTISLHELAPGFFPGTGFTDEIGEGEGEGFSVNLPFAPGTDGRAWLSAWRSAALPILRAFNPGAIVLQMGADTHALDPLAHLMLTAQEWLEAVVDVRDLGKPIVAVGGGGYNLTTVTRMWCLAAAALARVDLPDSTPASYHFRKRIPTLTDHHGYETPAREAEHARAFAARSVEALKHTLFPRFGL